VLRHARVRSVRVNVRKLDVVVGAVGVEIVREHSSSSGEARALGAAAKALSPS